MKRIVALSCITVAALGACSAAESEKPASTTSAIDGAPWAIPGFYRPSNANWYLAAGGAAMIVADGTGNPPEWTTAFEIPYGIPSASPGPMTSDQPVVGHWASAFGVAASYDTLGLFRPVDAPSNACPATRSQPAKNQWLFRNTDDAGPPEESSCFGLQGDLPVVGDWNHDGFTTIGVFRAAISAPNPASSNTCPTGEDEWQISDSLDGSAPRTLCFGAYGDIPVTGDWNGDGFSTIGVFRAAGQKYNSCPAGNAQWYLVDNLTTDARGNVLQTPTEICYGGPLDEPVVGDWNNDGISSIGVFRPPSTPRAPNPLNPGSFGNWLVRNTNDGGPYNYEFTIQSLAGDIPVVGNW